MRLIEGTPQEIAEFLRLTAADDKTENGAPTDADLAAPAAVKDVDWAQITALVDDRARSVGIARRVLAFLEGAVALGDVQIGPGESERTHDGLSNYVMVRDAGIRRYGAVAYVNALNGGLTLRLTRADLADPAPPAYFRDIRPGDPYAVNCPLHDDPAIPTALNLVRQALTKVRR